MKTQFKATRTIFIPYRSLGRFTILFKIDFHPNLGDQRSMCYYHFINFSLLKQLLMRFHIAC